MSDEDKLDEDKLDEEELAIEELELDCRSSPEQPLSNSSEHPRITA